MMTHSVDDHLHFGFESLKAYPQRVDVARGERKEYTGSVLFRTLDLLP
jgi:hypothetical protein